MSKKKLFKNYSIVFLGTGLGRGLSFATALILAHILGPQGFGIYSLFLTLVMLVWQLTSTVETAYIRYVQVDGGDKTVYLRTTLFLKTIISLLLLILAYPIAYFLSFYFFKKPDLLFYSALAIVCGVFLSMFLTLAGIYQAEERFYAFSLINLYFYAAVFLAVAGMILFRFTLTHWEVVWIYTATAMLLGGWGTVYLYKMSKPIFPVHTKVLFAMVHFSKWLLAQQFIYIILQRLDILFLTRFTNYTELGLYSAVVKVAMLANILTSAASFVLMPRGCASLKSHHQLKSYLKESLLAACALSILIVILIIFSPQLLKLFFGSQYAACFPAARILFLEAIFVVFYTPFSYLFYALRNTVQIFNLEVGKLIVAVVCLLLFVPKYGSLGAALSMAVSSFCGLLLVVLLSLAVIKKSRLNFKTLIAEEH